MASILITGGAGFVGLHTALALLREGHSVRILDNFDAQAHPTDEMPEFAIPTINAADIVRGDVRNASDIGREITGVDVIYHFAAAVGVGQSMYDFSRYFEVNTQGTAVLLDTLLRNKWRGRLVVASSMSIYGEGHEFRQIGEYWPLNCTSFYAQSKRHQEEMCLLFGETYKIPVVALRYFNIYGPGQTLSNPYTGVCAIFATRLLNGLQPIIFSDGEQSRDFVNVRDIVQANLLALEHGEGMAINIGSGVRTSIASIARKLAEVIGAEIEPRITHQQRAGDIRHCVADISLARRVLGYSPKVPLTDGLSELAEWLKGKKTPDKLESAISELCQHGLLRDEAISVTAQR